MPRSDKEKARIIENVAFTMKAEGFEVTPEQQADWQRILDGEVTSQQLMRRYIAQAREYGRRARSGASDAG